MSRRACLCAVACAALASACASAPSPPGEHDPLQKMNRAVYAFNDALDQRVMKPVVKVYKRAIPAPARAAITRFFANIEEPNVALNDFLQGKPRAGISDVGRFAANTTIGVVGLFDPAVKLGMEAHEEDLGQTLGVWGVGEGPYLILPFLGPTTFRDAPGDLLDAAIQQALLGPLPAIAGDALDALSFIDKRATVSDMLQAFDNAAVDRYVFMREAYRQHRTFLIYDGDPPLPPAESSSDASP